MNARLVSGGKLRKVLLRQREIDIDPVERCQLHHLLTRVDHLPNVHLPNTEHSIEWRADLFLRDERAHVVHRALLLAKSRLSRIQFLLRNNLSRRQIAFSFKIRFRQFQIGFCGVQLRFLGRAVEPH